MKLKLSQAERFNRQVLARAPRGKCILATPELGDTCTRGQRLQAHHVIPKAILRDRVAADWSEDEREALLWDPRNGVPVCRKHHHLLTIAFRALPPGRVPLVTMTFARDYGIEHLLEAEVPGLKLVRPATSVRCSPNMRHREAV